MNKDIMINKIAKKISGSSTQGDPWKACKEMTKLLNKSIDDVEYISVNEEKYNFGDGGYDKKVDKKIAKLYSLVEKTCDQIKKMAKDI